MPVEREPFGMTARPTGTIDRVDVAVVGASVAGLGAARAAAEAGARVVLLEARPRIGDPPAPANVAFDFLWRARIAPPADVVRRRLLGVRVRSPLHAAHALEVDAPLSILDRGAFDAHLADLARAAGADVRVGVAGLRALPDRTLVAGDGNGVRADVVVFADGAGTLARAFLRPVRDAHALAWGAAFALDAPGADDESFVTITPGGHAPGGRSQLNPLEGDAWAHWTFYRGAPDEAEPRARAALRRDARLAGFDERVVERAKFLGVAPDPVYTIPRELAADGLLVAGGAGGQGGIEVGLASGEAAGEAAARAALDGDASARALKRHERAWKRAHLSGYRSLRQVSDLSARLDDGALDALLAPWAGWRVPVRDVEGLAHRSLTRRGEAFAKLVARNPHSVPLAALVGVRALVSGLGRK